MGFNRAWPALLVIALASAAALGVETVRVEVTGGVPRLVVDGQAVRARMFWGGPRPKAYAIGPEAKRITFEFTPTANEPGHATMHLRFGKAAGDVFLDDIRVTDLDAGTDTIPLCDFEADMKAFHRDWTFWPMGKANTVGRVDVAAGAGRDGSAALRVRLRRPPDGTWPDFHIYHHPTLALRADHRYRVTLWARAEPARRLTLAFYRPGEPFVYLGGPPTPFVEQIRLAAEAGVDFVSFPLPMPWPRPGQTADWTHVNARCRQVLEANPGALLLPRVGLTPPRWWQEAHPDAMMAWDQPGQTRRAPVVASPVYRRAAAERLRALIEHVEEAFGPHVAGYHPCGQNTGEWFYQDTWKAALNGYAEASRRAWRAWLRKRYGTDAALAAAWGRPEVTLDAAEVPSPEARRDASRGILWHPKRDRPVIDFGAFQQEMMAECVCHFARTVREATRGRKLVVFFYGYTFEFGAIRNGSATAGHYAMRRVLDCPAIDVLCSPISYWDRGLGESGAAMSAAESVALAGKMWLYEDDTRTYLGTGTFPGWADGVHTLEHTNALLVRNTAQCALRNFGTWWMDLGSTGWFNDRRIWAEMVRLAALDRPLLARPTPFRPEVAAVVDERSMCRVAFDGHRVARPGVYEVRRPLGRMGAPYGQYLLDDVAVGRVNAKMVVFLSAWCLTPEQRRQIREATRGSLAVWCYAPGYHEPDRLSPDGMRDLTGFRLEKVSPEAAWAEPTQAGRALGLAEGFGVKGTIQPLFAAADATPEETLATYPDGSAAVALRKREDGWSLFVGPPGLTPDLLRLAARKAGVHLFTQSDCNVYANGPFVALHATADGPLEVNVGRQGPVTDVLTGKAVGRGPAITLPMTRGATRVLAVEPR